MVSREHRLTTAKDIGRVRKYGRGARNQLLGIRSIRNGLSVTRMTVVVSTKVSKRAVVRNRLRRRVREQVRLLLPSMPPGYDILLSLFPPSAKAPREELPAAVDALLRRNRLLSTQAFNRRDRL